MGTPLELVRYDLRSGKFEAGQEALQALERVKGPVGVVAVSGRARQGKSYILNQILGRSNGFQVSPTHKTCTKGLWLWSAPIERQTIDGQRFNLVVLDTEGIVAYDQTGQYSTQIFCLAVLLSSLFIYNQMGGIDEDSLDQLSLVTEMSKHIRVKANPQENTHTELSHFTPAFIWLLRDFYLRLEERDQTKITPKEYLEYALKPVNGESSAAQAKNQIRESIKGLFPDRECITLVRPVLEEADLAQLEQLPKQRLRPEFRHGVDSLMKLIWQKAKIKMVGNGIVNGPRLAALTRLYVDAINHGAVPTIATAWQGVEEQECRRAAEEAERAYKDAFQEDVTGDVATLTTEHLRAMEIATKVFESIALGDGTAKKAGQQKFREVLEFRFEQYRDKKLAEGEQQIDRRLYNQTLRMQQMIKNQQNITFDQINQEIDQFLLEYDENTFGAGKWPKLLEFMRNVYAHALQDMFQKQISDLQSQSVENQVQVQAAVGRANQMQKQLEDALQQKEMEVSKARQDAEIRIKEILSGQQKQTCEWDHKLMEKQNLINDLQNKLSSNENITRNLQSERNAREQELITELQNKETQLNRAKQEIAHGNQELEQLRRNAEAAAQQFRQDQSQLQAVVAQEQERVRKASEELKQLQAQYEMQLKENQNINNVNPESMTIKQISEWLLSNGHEAEVWQASNNRAKKAEWVALMNRLK